MSNRPLNLNAEIIQNKLRANENYKMLIYYRFLVDPISKPAKELIINFRTQDTAGGTGYFNITLASSIKDSEKPKLVC